MTREPSEELLLLIGGIDVKLGIFLEEAADTRKRVSALERDRTRLVAGFTSLVAAMAWVTHDRIPQLVALFR